MRILFRVLAVLLFLLSGPCILLFGADLYLLWLVWFLGLGGLGAILGAEKQTVWLILVISVGAGVAALSAVFALWIPLVLAAVVASGFLVFGLALRKWRRLTRGLLLAMPLFIVTFLVVRELPWFSLDWSGADRIDVRPLVGEWSFALTPTERQELARFTRQGSYHTIIKCGGTPYVVRVVRRGEVDEFFVHGSSVGPRPGGSVQSVFVPSESGFEDWLGQVLARHGHPVVPK